MSINLNLSKSQLSKAMQNKTFQLNASELQQSGNHVVNLSKKMITKLNKAINNNKGLRFIENEFNMSTSGGGWQKSIKKSNFINRASNVGAKALGNELEQNKVITKKQNKISLDIGNDLIDGNYKEAKAKSKTQAHKIVDGLGFFGKAIKGSQEAKDNMARLRAMRKPTTIDGGKFSFKKIGRDLKKAAKHEATNFINDNKRIMLKDAKEALKTTASVGIGAPITYVTGNPVLGALGASLIMDKSGANKKIDGLGYTPKILQPVGAGDQVIINRTSYGKGLKQSRSISGNGFLDNGNKLVYSNSSGKGLRPY